LKSDLNPYAVNIQKRYLDKLVPASRDNDGVGGDRAEAHTGHPLGVTIRLANGVLALS